MSTETNKYYVQWYNPTSKQWETILDTPSAGKAKKYVETIRFKVIKATTTTTEEVIYTSEEGVV